MKPFDLNLAKQGHPVCTRDGKPVRIICFNMKTENDQKIVALIDKGDYETIAHYYRNGHLLSYNTQNDADLMMAPEKHEGWVNVYSFDKRRYSTDSIIHLNKEDAISSSLGNDRLIATVKIEWEE